MPRKTNRTSKRMRRIAPDEFKIVRDQYHYIMQDMAAVQDVLYQHHMPSAVKVAERLLGYSRESLRDLMLEAEEAFEELSKTIAA